MTIANGIDRKKIERLPFSRPVCGALFALAALIGCSTPRGIPMEAELVTEATVKSSFQAPVDGRIWIYRASGRGSRGQLHYSGPIGAGQVLVIDPAMNKATIDGQELELVLPGGDVLYQAFFEADARVKRIISTRPPGNRSTMRTEDDYRGPAPSGADPARNDAGSHNGTE